MAAQSKNLTAPPKRKRGRPRKQKFGEPSPANVIPRFETNPVLRKKLIAGVDIGFSDDYVVLMGVPYINGEGKKLFYLVYGYKANQKLTKEIIPEIREDVARLLPGFLLDIIWLPHDSKQRRGTTHDTEFKIWKDSGMFRSAKDAVRHNSIEDRLRATMRYAPQVHITEEFMKCDHAESIIENLKNARFDERDGKTERLKHDDHSHAFDALSYLITSTFPRNSLWSDLAKNPTGKKEEVSHMGELVNNLIEVVSSGKKTRKWRTV